MAIAGLNNSILNTYNLTLTGTLNLHANLPATGSPPPGTPLPNRADLLTRSFLFVDLGFPVIDDLRGPLSALRVAAAGRYLTEHFQDTGLPVLDEFHKKDRVVQLRNDSLQNIRTRLERLQESVQALREGGALNLFSGFASDSRVIEVTAGSGAAATRFSVQVIQQATRDKLVSDIQSTGALGLSGTFSINGAEVTVVAGDSLLDIANKINRGEDRNGNGTLDGPEDLNGNGSIDIIEVASSQYFSGLYVIEDANNNGVLDPTEDTNGNGRLDGGTAETGVTAAVSPENRLTLLAAEGDTLNLDDPNGILLQLGFFVLNPQGVAVQKEKQLVTVNGAVQDLNQAFQKAVIEVDGATLRSATNTFNDVRQGISLTLNDTADAAIQVQVFVDARAAADQIASLVNNFNDALTAFNKVLGTDRLFSRDLDIQSLRNHLVQQSQDTLRRVNRQDVHTQALAGFQQDTRSVGIDSVNTAKTSFQEVGLTPAVANLRDPLADLFQHVGSKLFRELSSIGILSESDDTLKVNRAQLERTLTHNPQKVFDILNNADNGILTQLDPLLQQALSENLGILDLKKEQIQELAKVPSKVAALFQKNANNDLLKNLIAVV